jgi:hypothetical protein
MQTPEEWRVFGMVGILGIHMEWYNEIAEQEV